MKKEELYKLGNKIGLQEKDIDAIINNKTIQREYVEKEKPLIKVYDTYKGVGHYGTISIREFQRNQKINSDDSIKSKLSPKYIQSSCRLLQIS